MRLFPFILVAHVLQFGEIILHWFFHYFFLHSISLFSHSETPFHPVSFSFFFTIRISWTGPLNFLYFLSSIFKLFVSLFYSPGTFLKLCPLVHLLSFSFLLLYFTFLFFVWMFPFYSLFQAGQILDSQPWLYIRVTWGTLKITNASYPQRFIGLKLTLAFFKSSPDYSNMQQILRTIGLGHGVDKTIMISNNKAYFSSMLMVFITSCLGFVPYLLTQDGGWQSEPE